MIIFMFNLTSQIYLALQESPVSEIPLISMADDSKSEMSEARAD